MSIEFRLSFKPLSTFRFETNPIPLCLMYPHVFTFLAFKLKTFITYFTFVHVVIVFELMLKHSSWSVQVFLTQITFQGGCAAWKWLFSSFCVSNFSTHLTQENFLGFEYFLLSLYSTVLNTFFFGMDFSLLAGVSIFIAVPSTLGSNNRLVLVSSASGAVACSSLLVFGTVPDGCTCICFGARGTSYSSFSLSSGCISMSNNWFITFCVAVFITVPFTDEVLACTGCVSVLVVTGMLGVVGFLLLTGRGRLRGLVLYFFCSYSTC